MNADPLAKRSDAACEPRLRNKTFAPPIAAALAELARLDNWHALLAAATSYLIVAAAIVVGEQGWAWYVLAVWVIGSRQRALTTLLHDAAHGRAARNKLLNRFVGGYLSGYLIGQAFTPYRQSHVINHHWYLGDAERDPDFRLYLDADLYKGLTPARFFWRQVVATLLLLNAPAYLWYVAKHRLVALLASKRESIQVVALWLAIFTVVHVFDGWRILLMYWVVPYVTSFVIIGRFIEIAEHYPLVGAGAEHPASMEVHAGQSTLHATRNRFSHPLEALFFSMHHENFHLVHHLRPEIPFWNLKRAHWKMLEDSEYRLVNQPCGGIFVSRGARVALIPSIVSGRLRLPNAPAPRRFEVPVFESPEGRRRPA